MKSAPQPEALFPPETAGTAAAPKKAKAKAPPKPKPPTYLYGRAEWFGESFPEMQPQRRTELVQIAKTKLKQRTTQPDCRYAISAGITGKKSKCSKETGICTMRQYVKTHDDGKVAVVEGELGRLVTMCPSRFLEDGEIYKWIGKTLLNEENVHILNEIDFLEGYPGANTGGKEESDNVGRIDSVLIVPNSSPMKWCAVELQAVYHQGASYGADLPHIEAAAQSPDSPLPFPGGRRQPDYRSSGPKRLMPQLQTKIPSLRRWGKKMAVVVDESFFASLALKEAQKLPIKSISNADVAWFVVGYDAEQPHKLRRREVFLTTLENAVEGLTAGVPTSLEDFEARIKSKLPS